MKLTNKDTAEYLHRCYTAVDGLWFVKAEEKYGFNASLDLDEEVWKVIPKIQARFLKHKLGKNSGLMSLIECFSVKLNLDGFKFKIEKTSRNVVKIIISSCPWHNIMVKSNRAEFSEKIGSRICNAEYGVWAKEFGNNISFKLEDKICGGSRFCTLTFRSGK